MSTQQDMTAACDSALDYLYDMLSGEQKAAFETHLATCARCQAELASFGRVRTVAKSVLPAVDPTERLNGALHAQLMHAATQQAQQNQGGRVLPFIRRFVSHPGYAAAAGILFVGGVVGWQMAHGNLMMPAKHAEAPGITAAPPATEDSVAAPVAQPTTPPVVPAEKESTGAKGGGGIGLAQIEVSKREHAVSKDQLDGFASSEKKPAPGDGFGSGRSNAGPRATSTPSADLDRAAKRDDSPTSRSATSADKTSNGPAYGDPTSNEAAPSAAVAPAPDPAPPPAQVESATKAAKRRADAPAPMVAAAPKASADAKQAEERREQNQLAESDVAIQDRTPAKKAEGGAQNRRGYDGVDVVDADRTRANSLAQAGRCDEATVVFQALERKDPTRLTALDRLNYTRCLRTLGRLDPAQNELNQLRAQKNALPATSLEAEQQAIDLDRSRNMQTNKRAKSKRSAGAAESNDAVTKPADNAAKH